jgi:hypothetical protein
MDPDLNPANSAHLVLSLVMELFYVSLTILLSLAFDTTKIGSQIDISYLLRRAKLPDKDPYRRPPPVCGAVLDPQRRLHLPLPSLCCLQLGPSLVQHHLDGVALHSATLVKRLLPNH